MEESAPAIKVTALIVAYNSLPPLRRCLEALANSLAREQIEIIVVDCGSIDGTENVDSEFAGVTVLRLERHFGATKALNIGLRTAAADYVLLLDPDVIVEPDTITILSSALDTNESAAAVCPLVVDKSGQPRLSTLKLPSRETAGILWSNPDAYPRQSLDFAQSAITVEYPGRSAIMVRKAFVRAINWLDDRYGEFGGDLEFAWQMRRSRKQILIISSARATVIPTEPLRFDDAALATLAADRAHGVSVFLSKHFGWFAGLLFKIGAVFQVLGRLVTFQRPGFQFRHLTALLSGQKIDGSQRTL